MRANDRHGGEDRQRRREAFYQKAALPISVIALLLVLLKIFHGDMPM